MLQIALFLMPFTLKIVETTATNSKMKSRHAGKELRQLLLSPKWNNEALALCKIIGRQEIQEIPEATPAITYCVINRLSRCEPIDMVSDVNPQGTVDFMYHQIPCATVLGIHDLEAQRAL
ncbi:hypothetical protein BT93_A0942 [Corymbia citriodora subsp. variegata]|nr:hypothetical protein BT93_A0942 [Corymbia citriodora subsp. variegata]